MDDTIAAISTPLGQGAVAIIRVSGPQALALADRIFHNSAGRAADFPTHTVHLGRVGLNGTIVDQVLLTVMRGPRTFTGEDVVEINCHGGPVVARQVLNLCLANGARLAEPGEFTKRAFLNGRMDLTQAEAVMDVISAKTAAAHAAAERVLEGQLSARVNQIRDQLVHVLAHTEAHIDFPDDDIAPDTQQQLRRQVQECLDGVQRLLATAQHGKILRHGISIAIIGRPNVGKSSLLNALLGQERSIVTPIAGTTRDVIEESANIHGIPVRLADSAGIRKANSSVERLSAERSRKLLETSDAVLLVLDGSKRLAPQDREILRLSRAARSIVVLNKADLPARLVRLPEEFAAIRHVRVSAITQQNIDRLRTQIAELIWGLPGNTDPDAEVVVNERHATALRAAQTALRSVLQEMAVRSTPEIIAQQLRLALNAIGEIAGTITTDDILAKIFSSFCIGK